MGFKRKMTLILCSCLRVCVWLVAWHRRRWGMRPQTSDIGPGARFTQTLDVDDAKRIVIYLMHAPFSVRVEIEPHLNICQAAKTFGNYILFSIIGEKSRDVQYSLVRATPVTNDHLAYTTTFPSTDLFPMLSDL